jgi:SAM-dependent methyltransferase
VGGGVAQQVDEAPAGRDWDRLADRNSELVAPPGAAPLYAHASALAERAFDRDVAPRLARGTILEVGCGKGRWLRSLGARGFRVLGGDRSWPMLEQSRLAAPVAQLDARRLPFGDRCVDHVLTVTVIHHLSDPKPALAELARVARDRVVLYEQTRSGIPQRLHPDTFARSLDWYERELAQHGWETDAAFVVRPPPWTVLAGTLARHLTGPRDVSRAAGMLFARHAWMVFKRR